MNEERKVIVPSPENSETPLANAESWVTPNRLFFVRNHFDVPEIDLAAWRLNLAGCVQRQVELTWDEVSSLPTRSVFATVECAGNGRSFLETKASGVQWGAGAIGHAEWSGVPLSLLLKEAGLTPEAIEIVVTGADTGAEPDHPEEMHFARSLPLEKAVHPDTLLATRMNGEPLELAHGFPVRLLVPGWYGVTSVKWVTGLEAVSQPFDGYFQNVKYTIQRWTGRGMATESVGAMPVKSEIIRPQTNDELGIGSNRIFGMAWAGEDAVEAVEVSVDGGNSWSQAELIGPRAAYSWNLWEYLWEVVAPGPYTILSRAISQGGRIQPIKHASLNGGYQIDFSRPTHVVVKAGIRTRQQIGDRRSLLDAMNSFAEERAQLPLDIEMDLIHGGGI